MERKTQIMIAGSLITLTLILGGVFYLIHTKSNLKLHKDSVSWHRAQNESARLNHEIVTPKSKQEADELAQFLQKHNISQVWTGAAYLGNNGNFKNIIAFPSGTNVTYLPWFINQDGREVHNLNGEGRFCIYAARMPAGAGIKNKNNAIFIREEDCKTYKLPYVYKSK